MYITFVLHYPKVGFFFNMCSVFLIFARDFYKTMNLHCHFEWTRRVSPVQRGDTAAHYGADTTLNAMCRNCIFHQF